MRYTVTRDMIIQNTRCKSSSVTHASGSRRRLQVPLYPHVDLRSMGARLSRSGCHIVMRTR